MKEQLGCGATDLNQNLVVNELRTAAQRSCYLLDGGGHSIHPSGMDYRGYGVAVLRFNNTSPTFRHHLINFTKRDWRGQSLDVDLARYSLTPIQRLKNLSNLRK